jgi:hypothetical protein
MIKRMRLGSGLGLMVAASVVIASCGGGEGDGRKSPFATDNVTVAPQVEGRAPAPTPIQVPRPPAAEPTAETP